LFLNIKSLILILFIISSIVLLIFVSDILIKYILNNNFLIFNFWNEDYYISFLDQILNWLNFYKETVKNENYLIKNSFLIEYIKNNYLDLKKMLELLTIIFDYYTDIFINIKLILKDFLFKKNNLYLLTIFLYVQIIVCILYTVYSFIIISKITKKIKNNSSILYVKFLIFIKTISYYIAIIFKKTINYLRKLTIFLLIRSLFFWSVFPFELNEVRSILSNFDNETLKIYENDDVTNILSKLGNKTDRERDFEQRCINAGKIIWETDENGFKLNKIIRTEDGFRYIFDREYPKTTDIRTNNPNWDSSLDFQKFLRDYFNRDQIDFLNSSKTESETESKKISFDLKISGEILEQSQSKDVEIFVGRDILEKQETTNSISSSLNTTSSLGNIIRDERYTWTKEDIINSSLILISLNKFNLKYVNNIFYIIVLFMFTYIFCYSLFYIDYNTQVNELNNVILDNYECFTIPFIGKIKTFFKGFSKKNNNIDCDNSNLNNLLKIDANLNKNTVPENENLNNSLNTNSNLNENNEFETDSLNISSISFSLKELIKDNLSLLKDLKFEDIFNKKAQVGNLDLGENKRKRIEDWITEVNNKTNPDLQSKWFDSSDDSNSIIFSDSNKSKWFSSSEESLKSENIKKSNKSQDINFSDFKSKCFSTLMLSYKSKISNKFMKWIKTIIIKFIFRSIISFIVICICPLIAFLDINLILSASLIKIDEGLLKNKNKDLQSMWFDDDDKTSITVCTQNSKEKTESEISQLKVSTLKINSNNSQENLLESDNIWSPKYTQFDNISEERLFLNIRKRAIELRDNHNPFRSTWFDSSKRSNVKPLTNLDSFENEQRLKELEEIKENGGFLNYIKNLMKGLFSKINKNKIIKSGSEPFKSKWFD
jgi:hypothetical protein